MTYIMTNPAGYNSASSNYIVDISKPTKSKNRKNVIARQNPIILLFALFVAAPIALLVSLFVSVSATILPIAWVLGLL